ncbi:ABC transporter ATP-binding protein [Peptoniphilus equinus]|uniref:ABC transporter ATP-binding protein n=1 Tax=Peptoniphilus equinus TaxID=3016343 RepID=A0ABY7QW43_9FIRM|nr:ABC transporter ATP-binding protein [Peptoniphilus equinus]WBW50309.1 ABC transporter ATP-binding protein [Peptoniphilus equinus]
MNVLQVNHVSKQYKDFALKDVSFVIEKGTIMGFIGSNGAGKTTTIKAILGMVDYNGTILMNDQPLTLEAKQRIGFVLDDVHLGNFVTGADADKILSRVYHHWDSSYYFELLETFELPRNKKYAALSKGMKIKMLLAQALAIRPELLILDEPTSGLDPVARSEILDILLGFVEDENHSVLISSHINSDLEKIADYITFIQDGAIILSEEKYELYQKYGILRLTTDEFEALDKKYVQGYIKNHYSIDVLISDVPAFKAMHPQIDVDTVELDELMIFLSRGER